MASLREQYQGFWTHRETHQLVAVFRVCTETNSVLARETDENRHPLRTPKLDLEMEELERDYIKGVHIA